ncbi:hypothetical protein CFOL_v3_00823 [Cephalotus follicularis]|uniref:Myb-like domain-containing protein n=1 Tax=Cephalotus follicularis TaxID=3775 RepID=A0A1Q3ANU1_CEPFO|nr:hypothetical protein CFOL_v3_00823 [Cephalotus follicularis]
MDDDVSPADSSLPWIWIIEYLAGFKEVDTSILHDLIEMAPDDVRKNTSEVVALRCLEDFCGHINESTNGVPSASESKAAFDLSESCGDVLQRILQETSVSDMKIAGPELLKRVLYTFNTHKRASMPKCALQQLKDAIVEGTDPDAVSLRESSGLVCVNECDRMPADVGDYDLSTSRPDRSGNDVHVMADTMPADDGDYDLSTIRPDRSGNDVHVMAEGNLIPLTLENENGLSGDDLHNRNLSSSKRDRSDLATENLVRCINESQNSMNDSDELQLNVTKLKHGSCCADHSVGETSVPLHGDEFIENLSKRVVRVTEEERSDLQRGSQMGGLEGSRSAEDDLKRLKQSSDVATEKIHYKQMEIDHDAPKMPQNTIGDRPIQVGNADEANEAEPGISTDAPSVTVSTRHKDFADEGDHGFQPNTASLDELHQKINCDEAEGGMRHHCEQMSSDSDEHRDERIDITKKKSHFLSSQRTSSQNSLPTTDWTEQNLCVKCNNNGQLLVCGTSGCPLVVHEDCIGSPAKFDDKGNFCCPFCSYSLAISEYLQAKKESSEARKELAVFFRMNFKDHPKELGGSSGRKERNSRQNGDMDLNAMIDENGPLEGREHNQANQNGEHVNKDNEHPFQISIGDNQQPKPSASCSNVNLPCRDVEGNEVGGKACVFTGEKEEDDMVHDCSPSQHDEVQAGSECDGDDLSSKNREIVTENWKEAEAGIHEEDFQQQITYPEDNCAHNIDGEEASGSENDNVIISNYSIRLRRQETQYTYPSTPQFRRKTVPWTAKEEEILKKGVRKFSRVDDRKVPWKKILEFGSSVFLDCRTTIDLKDKWRNMCKSSPRYK